MQNMSGCYSSLQSNISVSAGAIPFQWICPGTHYTFVSRCAVMVKCLNQKTMWLNDRTDGTIEIIQRLQRFLNCFWIECFLNSNDYWIQMFIQFNCLLNSKFIWRTNVYCQRRKMSSQRVFGSRINAVRLFQQSKTTELRSALNLLNSLLDFFKSQTILINMRTIAWRGHAKARHKQQFGDVVAENVIDLHQCTDKFNISLKHI